MKKKKKEKFWDLKVPVFYNKKTGQASIVLPKKKIKLGKKQIKIRIWG